jgi:riboflavin kinase/FMN adenylyltransferase
MSDVPAAMKEGVYACYVTFDEKEFPATLHYGPRPVFKDTPSCEAHLLDEVVDTPPTSVTVETIEWLRSVENFPSVDALKEQIAIDIQRARGILKRP